MGSSFILKTQNKNLTAKNLPCFNPDYMLDCGQSFRWRKNSKGNMCAVITVNKNGSPSPFFCELSAVQNGDGTADVTFFNCSEEDFYSYLVPYFDLERDYDAVLKCLSGDEYLKKAIDSYYGIRITNQDPWETLCSFIISQNNNIPRIKGIIDRLCEAFGEPVAKTEFPDTGVKTLYSFPGADALAIINAEDLAPLRAGFRNKYITDAAQKAASGEVKLSALSALPLSDAEAELVKIKGVGPKVAQCVLLYGCGHADAFPVDVWVKRILSELYPDGLPDCTAGVRGIAQQYLFHWRRHLSVQ